LSGKQWSHRESDEQGLMNSAIHDHHNRVSAI
jgi:hypothetical protein